MHMIAVAAILYALYGVSNLFSHGDTTGGIGAIVIGVGGVLMFVGMGLIGFICMGVGVAMTFMGPTTV